MTSQPQRILIISCLGGMGHVRAAKALLASAEENHPELTVRHIDAVDYCNWFLKASAVDSYEIMIKHWPGLFKKIFEFADTPGGKESFEKSMFLVKQGNKKLLEYVEEFKPDRIIATHFIVPILLSSIQNQFPIDVVVTDYYANLMWINPEVRHLFVASEAIKQAFDKSHPSIIVSGIPINPRFFKPKNKETLYKKLKLPTDKSIILVLSGGSGLIDTSSVVEKILSLHENVSVVAIAGKNNPELFSKLQKIKSDKNNYQALEFVDTIDEWMYMADVIVSKPGGLTTSEVLYLKKPLLMINPIPGQEEKNAEFVTEHNYGIRIQNTEELPAIITKVLHEPNFLTKPPELPNPNEIILTTN
jgi:processive 1,2-diacylglycerol beta-glucosyltransferase